LVITAPPYEWPTSSTAASRLVELVDAAVVQATSSASEVIGLVTDTHRPVAGWLQQGLDLGPGGRRAAGAVHQDDVGMVIRPFASGIEDEVEQVDPTLTR
jgi:hypothetical protein